MIPILYEKDEKDFVSNGICRLPDCLSCVVTEERNGVYECDFDYPKTGNHFEEILCGRILGVTHDDTGDIQPFDIVGYSAPISGVVSFHAVHVSYRLSKHIGINQSVTTAQTAQFYLDRLQSFVRSEDEQFTFTTDIMSSAFHTLWSQVNYPYIIKEWMGGTEGSVLDMFHGEWKFDKFNCSLLSARGQDRDLTIRYGLNMTEYNDECDYSESANSFVAFWQGEEHAICGMASNVLPSHDGRLSYTIYDLTEQFESEPTGAQLRAAGRSKMIAEHANNPAQTINVSFVRLQDSEEYEQYRILMQCALCDTINVIFPAYNMSQRMKIVKVEWDVLRDRYNSMELGELSTTLSQAMGINSSSGSSSSSGGGETADDYVVSHGTSGIWTYRVWDSGIKECWGIYTANIAITIDSPTYGGYRSGNLNIPTFPIAFANLPSITATAGSTKGYWVNNVVPTNTGGNFFLSSGGSLAAENRSVNFHVIGT